MTDITRWSDQQHIGTHNRVEVLTVMNTATATIVRVRVSGNGFNGDGTFVFKFRADRIQELTIS
ncbi:hypothetical protein [Curtobacterium sp. PhB130]|uniref:hypothetical protein n=1 Tax=Curtobacterium sp. PhB130 TaxID=2485178 RepID=UPI000F4C6457|nr:hypothetical protein [Curtobacterium sp. PhB130]